MAHLLGERGEGAQVRGVEPLARVGLLEVRADRLVQDDADAHLVPLLRDEGAAAPAGEVGHLRGRDEVVGHRGLGVERVEGLQPPLDVDRELAQAIARGIGRRAQCRALPDGATGVMPCSARSAAARGLPVAAQRS